MSFSRRAFKRVPFSLRLKMLDAALRKAGIIVKIAETEAEKKQVYRLRWRVYSDRDYIAPEDYPDGMLTDKYEPFAVSFLSLSGSTPVGTARVIRYSKLGFPTEKTFNITEWPFELPRERTGELSKLCVKKEFRNGLVSLGVLKAALQYSKKEGVDYWIMFTTQKLADYFEEVLGVPITRLTVGPLAQKHSEERKIAGSRYFQRFELHPYLLDLRKIKKAIAARGQDSAIRRGNTA